LHFKEDDKSYVLQENVNLYTIDLWELVESIDTHLFLQHLNKTVKGFIEKCNNKPNRRYNPLY